MIDMTIQEIKHIIKRKIINQMIIVEAAVKDDNYRIAYENVNLVKAYIMLINEIQEGEYNASIK